RYLIRKMLGGLPWPVDEVAGGEEGICRARKAKPRMILLDLSMPGLSGFETLIRLKSDPLTKETPVVIITSLPLTFGEREELMTRASAILSKEGLSKATLLEAIRQAAGEV